MTQPTEFFAFGLIKWSFQVAKIRCEEGGQETHFLFYDGETISGTVGVAVKKKFDHQGIRIEFIGQIGTPFFLNFVLF